MATLQEISYVPFEQQQTVHLSLKRIKAIVTGARAGKTLCMAHEFVDKCIRQPNYRYCEALQDNPYTVVAAAPTYRILERVLLPTILKIIPNKLKIGRYHQTKRQLLVHGRIGTTCIYFANASDPEAWQGEELYGVWLDEFALIKEAMFDEAETRLSTKRGWLLLSGTLRRGPGWAQKRVKEFSESERGKKEIELIQWRTIDNPYTDKEHLEYMRRTTPDRYFARMFEASWDTFVGQIYDEFDRKVHCVSAKDYTIKMPNGRIIGNGPVKLNFVRVAAGVDWGHAHPGVIVVAGKTIDGTWYLVEEVYKYGMLVAHENPTQQSWLREGRRLKVEWGVEVFWCDPSEPGHIAAFKKARLPAKPADNDVAEGIMRVAELMHVDKMTERPKFYIFDRLEHSIEEIMHYQWEEDKTGGQKEKPVKENDHACDAIRYMLFNEIKRGAFKPEPEYMK